MNTEHSNNAHPVNAFDRRTWDEDANTYFTFVDDVMRDNYNNPFHNGRPLHAVYLTYKFFLKAKSRVRLFSGNLIQELKDGPDKGMQFYSARHIISSILYFLTKEGSELKILLEADVDVDKGQSIKDHPLVKTLESWKASENAEHPLKGHCEIRQISTATLKRLREKKLDFHMLIKDDSAYRIEFDREKQKAYVNVNDKI